jgi:hypothetical protein
MGSLLKPGIIAGLTGGILLVCSRPDGERIFEFRENPELRGPSLQYGLQMMETEDLPMISVAAVSSRRVLRPVERKVRTRREMSGELQALNIGQSLYFGVGWAPIPTESPLALRFSLRRVGIFRNEMDVIHRMSKRKDSWH